MSYTPVRFKKRAISEINVVPYIDVMLVLLIIFMVTAPLLSQGVDIELPKTVSEPLKSDSKEPIVVTVTKKGEYFLNIGQKPDNAVDDQTLVARIAAVLRHQPGTPIMVRGDRNTMYGNVVTVMALLQKAGVPKVGLITEAPDLSRKKRSKNR